MKIIITRDANKDKEVTMSVWKPMAFKAALFNLIIAAGGIMLLLGKYQINGKEAPFWNVVSAFGLGFILMSFLRFIGLLKNWSAILSNHYEESTLEIDEEKILFKKQKASFEYQWTYFNYFRKQGTVLLLSKELKFKYLMYIDTAEVSDQELNFIERQIFQFGIKKK